MMSPSPGADWRAERELLARAVLAGGELAMTRFQKPLDKRRKADGSFVTDADEAVDALIAAILRQARPDVAWLSEESAEPAETRLEKRATWIVDPIDGTRSFIKGEPDFCIAACLAVEGRPVAAAVFCPPRGELFTAAAGAGATLNEAPMRAREITALDRALGLASEKVFVGAQRPPMQLAPIPAMCLALADLAAGRVDIVAARGMKADWDLAPGALLVAEAGGAATRLDGSAFLFAGDPPRQPGLLAAGPGLHRLLKDQVRPALESGDGA